MNVNCVYHYRGMRVAYVTFYERWYYLGTYNDLSKATIARKIEEKICLFLDEFSI